MSLRAYYVYALKDPRQHPAKPFYVGKGTGNRAWEHELRIDTSSKGHRIRAIQLAGKVVVTTVLADALDELTALKLEAELIAAFGTEEHGGILTNRVSPTGNMKPRADSLIVPSGTIEKAQLGLSFLKDAVLELARANSKGITNSEISKGLGLQSDYKGGSKDYLAWSLLGLLMKDGQMERVKDRRHIARTK